jgi:protoporphyrinogen IX oxidase
MAAAITLVRRWIRAEVALVLTGVALGILIYASPPWLYPWLKAVHIIAIIAWMAGMLYLPRLFVYHADTEVGSKQSETFKVMEHRLLTIITNPAMVTSWVLGLWLAWSGPDSDYGWFSSGWLWAKLCLVLALSAVHGFFVRCVREFAADQNRRTAGFYRAINELPTVLMIGIVLLVVLKPF